MKVRGSARCGGGGQSRQKAESRSGGLANAAGRVLVPCHKRPRLGVLPATSPQARGRLWLRQQSPEVCRACRERSNFSLRPSGVRLQGRSTFTPNRFCSTSRKSGKL